MGEADGQLIVTAGVNISLDGVLPSIRATAVEGTALHGKGSYAISC